MCGECVFVPVSKWHNPGMAGVAADTARGGFVALGWR
jgi:hypothetical protein